MHRRKPPDQHPYHPAKADPIESKNPKKETKTMRKHLKKALVVLLSIAMLLSNMNLQAFAAEAEESGSQETVVEQQQTEDITVEGEGQEAEPEPENGEAGQDGEENNDVTVTDDETGEDVRHVL